MNSLPALILSVVMLIGFTPRTSQTLKTVRPDKPINCEDFQGHLDHAIIEWENLKESRLILIARLGTGERNRKLNRERLAYVEDYLKRHKVDFVFAEGDRVEGLGRMEVYVGGRLAMSIPLMKGSRRLCWGSNGE